MKNVINVSQGKEILRLSPIDRVQLNYQVGGALTNFGPKVGYWVELDSLNNFIPTELSGGVLISPELRLNEKVKLNVNIAYQAGKLLVPTPPIYDYPSGEILDGFDPDISPYTALYRSFYDAPGGFREEIQEIIHKIGIETRISYNDRLYMALRFGRFMESWKKGNRKYNTLGISLGAYGFTLDGKLLIASNNLILHKTFALTVGFQTSF